MTYLTPKAVAERLSVSDRTARRWMASGDMPALLLPSGDYRVDPTALAAWERERQEIARIVSVKDAAVRKRP